MSNLQGKIPYLKVNKLLWTWKACEGAEGCLIVDNISLSMGMAPPPLRDQAKPVPPPKPVAKKQDRVTNTLDGLLSAAEGISRFKKWLDTPEPPRQPKPAPVIKQEKRKTVPPFDIQEIPRAMRTLMMPMSAKLMEKWFAGQLNYSPDDDAERAMLNQDDKPYPPSMIDTTTITMDWILKFGRAKAQFENLTNTLIYSERAKGIVAKKLAPYIDAYEVRPWERCRNDLQLLHKHFQFQFAPVEGTLEQKAIQWLHRLPRGGAPDDLTGSLGSFNFYAAIAGAKIDRSRGTATVTHIVVYVKDHYTFDTKPGMPSQYLGHWNSSGVLVVPEFMATDVSGWRWLDYPVLRGDMPSDLFRKDAVFYPVRNETFRKWQLKHRQGGDFVIYTDYKPFRVNPPMTVYL